MAPGNIKAVFFDFMGTCLDWHGSVVRATPGAVPRDEASRLALEWRRQYLAENSRRFHAGLKPEDIDETLARTFEVTYRHDEGKASHFDDAARGQMIKAWHAQAAWPEVEQAIRKLRDELGLEVFVHGNGTTRLQLDLTKFSGLRFNMIFSSELLGVYKPSPESYNKALRLVRHEPGEVVMVAAHAYDLGGAQKCGMKTVYVHRWTDDIDEDMDKVKGEFDTFLESMDDLAATIQRF